MAANTQFVTEEIIRNAPLPNHGGRYGVIPHGFIIDETRKQLEALNIPIKSEVYKVNKDGQIAQGIYYLEHSQDADMGMMFAWSNSYNKMMSFKCAVGAHVFICMNGVVSGDIAKYSRKHVGSTALNDAVTSIQGQLNDLNNHYIKLLADKEMLKNVQLTDRAKAEILGRLFCQEEILTPTQTSIVKREIHTPSFNYNADENSAWALYNHVTLALKESHPIRYISDHQKVHTFFVDEFSSMPTAKIISSYIDDEDEEETYDVQPPEPVSPAGNLFGVNFL